MGNFTRVGSLETDPDSFLESGLDGHIHNKLVCRYMICVFVVRVLQRVAGVVKQSPSPLTGTQRRSSAATLKTMGGTITHPSFAALLEFTANKRLACHVTSQSAAKRARGSGMQHEGCAPTNANALRERTLLFTTTMPRWTTEGGT